MYVFRPNAFGVETNLDCNIYIVNYIRINSLQFISCGPNAFIGMKMSEPRLVYTCFKSG